MNLKTKSKWMIISMILNIIYTCSLINNFFGGVATSTGGEQIGAALATTIVLPYMLIFALGTIFSIVGVITEKNWACITACVLVFVSAIVFILYAMISIPLGIIALIGCICQNKINKNKQEE